MSDYNTNEDVADAILALPEISDLQKKLAEVEAELDLMKTAGIIELAIRNPSVSEYMHHWERRAEAAEARIDELTEALQLILFGYGPNHLSKYARDTARAALEATND